VKAIVYHTFGPADLLGAEELPVPALTDNQVLVALRATSINVIDSRVREGKMGILVNKHFPKTPGSDVAGVVESVGSGVSRFQPGDEVFGATNPFQGGAFAEFAALPEGALAMKPKSMSFEQAAALPITGLAALYSLRELGEISQGSRVLIYGSSGSAGLFAIQLGKLLGGHLTAVCGTNGVDLCKQFGADVALDYRYGPVMLNGPYDIVIDFSGHLGFEAARHHMTDHGRFIDPSPTVPQFVGAKIANPFRSQKDLMLQTESKAEDLEFLASLVDSGKLKVTIAKSFPIAQSRQAFELQEQGGLVGKIVVTIP
jgi:NADPH:quinone reductase-like Zn-dependent oxidoreductase